MLLLPKILCLVKEFNLVEEDMDNKKLIVDVEPLVTRDGTNFYYLNRILELDLAKLNNLVFVDCYLIK